MSFRVQRTTIPLLLIGTKLILSKFNTMDQKVLAQFHSGLFRKSRTKKKAEQKKAEQKTEQKTEQKKKKKKF